MTHESTLPPRDERPHTARPVAPRPAAPRVPMEQRRSAGDLRAWVGATLARAWAQPWLREILALFVASRVGFLLITYVGYILVLAPKYSTFSLGAQNVAAAWDQWDGARYLAIAQAGYTTRSETAFFPLYPLLTHLLTLPFGGHGAYWSALLISNLAFLGGVVLLYLVAAPLWGGRVASLAVLYLTLFPTALYFFAPYNESLFLLFVLGCFLALQRRHWALAGALGGLAALSRAAGLFLVIPYVVVWWQASGRFWWRTCLWRTQERHPTQPRSGVPNSSWRSLLVRGERLLPRQSGGSAPVDVKPAPLAVLGWSLLIPLAQGLYAAYCAARFGDPLAFSHAQTSWNRLTEAPWTTFGWQFQGLAGAAPASFYQVHDALDLAAALFCVAMLVVAWRRLPVAQTLFAAALLILELSLPGGVASHLNDPMTSVQRFALELFPAFIVLALLTVDRPRAREAILLCSVMLLATLSLVFILGRWLV